MRFHSPFLRPFCVRFLLVRWHVPVISFAVGLGAFSYYPHFLSQLWAGWGGCCGIRGGRTRNCALLLLLFHAVLAFSCGIHAIRRGWGAGGEGVESAESTLLVIVNSNATSSARRHPSFWDAITAIPLLRFVLLDFPDALGLKRRICLNGKWASECFTLRFAPRAENACNYILDLSVSLEAIPLEHISRGHGKRANTELFSQSLSLLPRLCGLRSGRGGYVRYIQKALKKGYLEHPGLHAVLTTCLRFSSVSDSA